MVNVLNLKFLVWEDVSLLVLVVLVYVIIVIMYFYLNCFCLNIYNFFKEINEERIYYCSIIVMFIFICVIRSFCMF